MVNITGERKHECLICNRRCLSANGLKLHMRIKHRKLVGCEINKAERINCAICGQILVHARRLKHHMRDRHPNKTHPPVAAQQQPMLTCVFCRQQCMNKSGLTCHQQRKHPEEWMKLCNQDKKVLPDSTPNTEAVNRPAAAKPPATITTSPTSSFVCSKRYPVCTMCRPNRRFKSPFGLTQHLKRTHTQQTNQKKEMFPCPICPSRTFKSKSSVEKHLKRTHILSLWNLPHPHQPNNN